MVNTVVPDTDLEIRNLTIDYSTGHVLIDGRPIGTFVAQQGPEIVGSPYEDLYVVNVPLMVRSVTFLPSGNHFERATAGFVAALHKFVSAAAGPGDPRVSLADVRLALAQVLPKDDHTRWRILDLLDDRADETNRADIARLRELVDEPDNSEAESENEEEDDA